MKYFFETLKLKNETLFYFGLLCVLGSAICLVLSKLNPNHILGVSGWIKPFKFFISTTIMAWTMGFYMHYLENQNQVSIYNWSMILFLSIEIILITYQASRGRISHFNQEDTAGRVIFGIMAIAITLFMLHTAYIAVLFFTQVNFHAPALLILAIKLSLIITVLFAFEGFAMGALLKHTVGFSDGSEGLPLVNWSKHYGDLRIAHFFGMHALQIIPLLTVLIARNKQEVWLIALLYLAFVTFTLLQALMGKPFIKL
jgi:hypothetical protein